MKVSVKLTWCDAEDITEVKVISNGELQQDGEVFELAAEESVSHERIAVQVLCHGNVQLS